MHCGSRKPEKSSGSHNMAELGSERNRDATKEHIKVELEIAKFLAFSSLATVGGSFGIILGGIDTVRLSLGAAGLLAACVGFGLLRATYITIRVLLRALRENV
jgi:hypothetical protein